MIEGSTIHSIYLPGSRIARPVVYHELEPGQYLFLLLGKHSGRWGLPETIVKPGEKSVDALLRIVRFATGFEQVSVQRDSLYTEQYHRGGSHTELFAAAVRVDDKNLIQLKERKGLASNFGWFEYKDAHEFLDLLGRSDQYRTFTEVCRIGRLEQMAERVNGRVEIP